MPNISQRQAFPFQKKMEKIPVYNNRLYGDLFSQHTCTCAHIYKNKSIRSLTVIRLRKLKFIFNFHIIE